MVWKNDTARAFRYVEHVPFALRASMRLRERGGDSARWGAVSLSAVSDELFMLFGGRPVRKAHPAEPTVWIDVYGFDGGYRRSYRLPFDAEAMATDGRTFYLLHTDILPKLVALRPRTSR